MEGGPGKTQASGNGNALPGTIEGHRMRRQGRVRQLLPDRPGKTRRGQIALGQDRGEAEGLQALGAQALLRLAGGLERDEHRPHAGAQQVDHRVVARLADRNLCA
jgi:hypothetical protein